MTQKCPECGGNIVFTSEPYLSSDKSYCECYAVCEECHSEMSVYYDFTTIVSF